MLHDKDLVSIQEARTKVEKAYAAAQKFRSFTQEQVDAIVERMAAAGRTGYAAYGVPMAPRNTRGTGSVRTRRQARAGRPVGPARLA